MSRLNYTFGGANLEVSFQSATPDVPICPDLPSVTARLLSLYEKAHVVGKSDSFRRLVEAFAHEVDAYLDDQFLAGSSGKKPAKKKPIMDELRVYDRKKG